jgi:hypothetical protein
MPNSDLIQEQRSQVSEIHVDYIRTLPEQRRIKLAEGPISQQLHNQSKKLKTSLHTEHTGLEGTL